MGNFFVPENAEKDLKRLAIGCQCARKIAEAHATYSNNEENIVILQIKHLETVLNRAKGLVLTEGKDAYVACMFARVKNHAGQQPGQKLSMILFPVVKNKDERKFDDYDFFDEDRKGVSIIHETWIDPSDGDTPAISAINHFFPNDLEKCPGIPDQDCPDLYLG